MRQDVKTWWKLIWSTHWSVHCGNIFPATMWRANHHICSSTTHKHTFINSTLKSDMKTNMLICWHPVVGRWCTRLGEEAGRLTTATGAVGPAASLWVTAHRLCLCMKLFIVWICGNVWPDLSVCPWICLWISVCVFVLAAASALPIQSLSPWAEVNHLSAIKVKERTAVTDTSQDTSVSAVSLQTHTHSLYAHSLASPSFSLFSHCSKTVVRFPSFFRWRCLPPTHATLMFQDNLVH